MQLLDSCLKSPLLPAYLAASFAKKLGRLLLSVPPSGALVITALVHNILRRHPSINCLVHRVMIVSFLSFFYAITLLVNFCFLDYFFSIGDVDEDHVKIYGVEGNKEVIFIIRRSFINFSIMKMIYVAFMTYFIFRTGRTYFSIQLI